MRRLITNLLIAVFLLFAGGCTEVSNGMKGLLENAGSVIRSFGEKLWMPAEGHTARRENARQDDISLK